MRILFIYPNLYTQMGFNHGLASLSAVLKEQGHETQLLNLNEKLPPVLGLEDIAEVVRTWQPGLIGFSCLTMQYPEALRIAGHLRESAGRGELDLPPLVMGGIHPTMVPAEVMSDGMWDHVGMGECEDALLELVRRLEAGETPDDVRNFLSWSGGARPSAADSAPAQPLTPDSWVTNPVGEFPAVESLPRPDYELFDTQRILDQKQGWFGLLSSRGCPYRCTYCLNHRVVDMYRRDLGRSVSQIGFLRCRPVELLIEEIRWVLERYEGIETFIVDDDLFTQHPEHAIEFCDAYAAAGFDVPWVCNSHVKRLEPEVAAALARGGCRILKLGLESGSPRVRSEVLQRIMTDADILATAAEAERHGLHSSAFLMVGLPSETHAERWETVDLLARAAFGRFRTSLFFPFPGTASHDHALRTGELSPERAGALTDFTEASSLDFGEAENLFIAKLAACMPWFVNSRLDRYHEAPAAARYRPLVDRVLAMDRAAWEAFEPSVRELDGELADAATAAGERHYAIRYNAFMGVRDDWYEAEQASTAPEFDSVVVPPGSKKIAALAADLSC